MENRVIESSLDPGMTGMSLTAVSRRLAVLLSVAVLSGCMLAPGLHLSSTDFDGDAPAEEKALADQSPELEVALVPVTPALVRRQATELSQQPGVAVSLSDPTPHIYRVGPQDVLSIIVWEHPELTIPAGGERPVEKAGHQVNNDGQIFYPYVGLVHVAGKTTDQIRTELTRQLSRFIKRPQLDVRVVAFNSQKVYVSGQVKQPGNLPISDVPLHVADAVNAAGGALPTGDVSRVVLSRDGKKQLLNLVALYSFGDVSQNLLMRSGDLLYVPENNTNKVYVMGEVKKPAALPLFDGRMTLAEALSTGGIDQNAAAGRVYILRRNGEGALAYHLDASEPDALILATAFQLKPLDVVFVSTAGVSRWNRVMSQLLPTAQTLWTLDRLDPANTQ
ncbi:MAG: polysaccharide export protein [Gammaproteobacteria bacterium]|nr:polysaccharide export protein [Gammaproteobacteria bacterium]